VEELASARRKRRNTSNENAEVLDQAAVKVWRQHVVQGFFVVVDHFDLPRDVVYVSAEILDCYTATSLMDSIISNSRYQEVSIASIFLATRMLKKSSRISMETFLLETMGKTCKITPSQAMEVVREVSSALDWTYPILPPSVFVKQLVGITSHLIPRASPHRRRISEALEHTLYLTELAIMADLSSSHSSDIALAAMIQTMNPKTGPADCCLTQEVFQSMTEELEKEIYLDCSNATIQNISAKLAKIYSESLVFRSTNDGGEPMHTSLETSPVLIEEDQEDEEPIFDTNGNDIKECNHPIEYLAESPAKRIRTI